MKQVLVIHGSPRKKNTYKLVKQVEKLIPNAEFGYILLWKMNIQDCLGCMRCITEGNCPRSDDDVSLIIEKMKKADGIVFTSPIYLFNISYLLKRFLDRSIILYHRPVLASKPALVVTTVAGSPPDKVHEYMRQVIWSFGMAYSGAIHRNVPNRDVPVKEKEVKEFNELLQNGTSDYKAPLGQIITFNVLKVTSKISSKLDVEYWENHGLYDSNFYWECKVNPIKNFLGKRIYRQVSKEMDRTH